MADERRAPVQADGPYKDGREAKRRGSVTWAEHLEAAKDYNLRHSQSAEQLAERGGFGYWEMTKHLGHEPMTWREADR